MTVYVAHTQSSDKMWFPREDAMRVLTAAKQKAVLDSDIVRLKHDIVNYEKAVNSLQMALKICDQRDSVTIASYNREIDILQSQKADYAKLVSGLEKQLRRARRGKKLIAVAGLLLSAGVGWLTTR